MIVHTVEGTPKTKKRWRTGKGHSYNPSQKDEQLFRASVLAEYHPDCIVKYPQGEPVGIIGTFAFPIPKADKKITEGQFRPKTPDIDNLEKLLMDAIKGIFWEDDRQVVFKIMEQVYSIRPRTEFIIFKPTKQLRNIIWEQTIFQIEDLPF